jgi:hypothetical protein
MIGQLVQYARRALAGQLAPPSYRNRIATTYLYRKFLVSSLPKELTLNSGGQVTFIQ